MRQVRRVRVAAWPMSHLPAALESLPETNRAHSETLRAIHTQLEQQNSQQEKLSDILEKMSEAGGSQRDTLNEVRVHIAHRRY